MKSKSKAYVYIAAIAVIIVAVVAVFVSIKGSNIKAPEELSAKNTQGGIMLSWKHVKGASEYEIYKKVSKQWMLQSITKEKSFSDLEVKDGKSYSYQIRGKSKFSEGEYSSIKQMYLSEPSISDTENTTDGIEVSWNQTDGAKGYVVLRKEAAGDEVQSDWNELAKVSSNESSFVDETAQNGRTYAYCVKQVSGKFESAFGDNMQEVVCSESVKGLSVKNSPSGVVLSWKAYTDASGYCVMRKTGDEETWSEIASNSTTGTSYIDSSASYGKKNAYKVCAVLADGQKSALSSSVELYAVDPSKPMVALTFDDGPYRPVTTKILDTAEKYGARVTFFVVGSRVDTYSDCVERADSLGCQIGSHTYNHTILTSVSNEVRQKELADTNEVVKKYIGKDIKIVRCPGGAANDDVKNTVKYPLINWSVDTLDWKTRNTDSTIANIKNNVGDGSIVLMHDLYESTGNAMTQIIPYLTEKGYQLVTVSELMEARGVTPVDGQLYFNFPKK